MKKRSFLHTILCSILLFGTSLSLIASNQAAIEVPKVGRKKAVTSKGSAYSRFAGWLRAQANASTRDIRSLWRWGSKKARGQLPSERESAAAKRVAKKIGISLAVITSFFYGKKLVDNHRYKKNADIVYKITPAFLDGQSSDIAGRMVTAVENNDLDSVKRIIKVARHESTRPRIGQVERGRLFRSLMMGLWKACNDHRIVGDDKKLEIIEELLKNVLSDHIYDPNNVFSGEPKNHAVTAMQSNHEPEMKKKILKLLFDYRMPMTGKGDFRKNLLTLAVEKNYKDIAMLLLEKVESDPNVALIMSDISVLDERKTDARWKDVFQEAQRVQEKYCRDHYPGL